MRAFILRRVALIEVGAGTVILGKADGADSIRLQNFLRRNGVPHTVLDPDSDECAAHIIERLGIKPERVCPSPSAPMASLLRQPTEKAAREVPGPSSALRARLASST